MKLLDKLLAWIGLVRISQAECTVYVDLPKSESFKVTIIPNNRRGPGSLEVTVRHKGKISIGRILYMGRCPVCSDTTTAYKPGDHPCKWGRCNGTVYTNTEVTP